MGTRVSCFMFAARLHYLFQFSLRSRCTAMLAGLPTLIQTRHGPDRYVLSIRLETIPSAPSRHACAKTIAPSSAMCSLNRMPVPVLRNSPASAGLAIEEWPIAHVLAVMLD